MIESRGTSLDTGGLGPLMVQTASAAPTRLRAAEAAFYALIFSLPLETILYYQQDNTNPNSTISIARVAGFLLLACAVVDWKRCFREIPVSFWLIACYLLAYALSRLTIPSQAVPLFQERQSTVFQLAALFLISFNLLRDPDYRRKALIFYGWLMALCAVGVITGVFGGVQMDPNVANVEDRYSLLGQDPNLTAGMFGMAALCLLSDPRLLAARRKLGRVALTGVAVLVLVVAVLKTGSRGGLLAFGAGLLAFGICPGRSTRKVRFAILLATLAVSGGLIAREFVRDTSTAERLRRAWQDDDTAGRIEIFDTAWTMFKERPLLGWGGGNNRFMLGARLNFPGRETHNLFLNVLTEVGLIGSVPFFIALLDVMRRSWQAGRRSGDAMLLPLVCALLIMCCSITGIEEKLFWIILAAGAAGGP